MKKITIVLGICCVILLTSCGIFGQIIGSDNIITMELPDQPEGFETVKASAYVKAIIVPPSAKDKKQNINYKLEIKVNENLEKYVQIENKNGTLSIGLKNVSLLKKIKIEATIIMPVLKEVVAEKAAIVEIRDFKGLKTLNLKATSSSQIIGTVEVTEKLDAEATTNGKITLQGSAKELKLTANTSGEMNLSDLQAEDIDAILSTSAMGTINDPKTLKVDLSKTAKLTYSGNPSIVKSSVTSGAELNQE